MYNRDVTVPHQKVRKFRTALSLKDLPFIPVLFSSRTAHPFVFAAPVESAVIMHRQEPYKFVRALYKLIKMGVQDIFQKWQMWIK